MKKRRKTGTAIFAVLLLLSLLISGCAKKPANAPENFPTQPTVDISEHQLETVELSDDGIDAQFVYVGKIIVPEIPGYKSINLKMGYKSLQSDVQREFYDMLTKNVFYVSKEKNEDGLYYTKQVTISNFNLSQAELRLIIMAFSEDNPQVFWLSDVFGFSNSSNETVLQLYSYLSIDDISHKIGELNTFSRNFAAEFPLELDDYYREKYIHSYLLDHCSYAENVRGIHDDFHAFGIYGALISKRAVCEGYSRAFQWLLSIVGIQSVNVIGKTEDSLHMWNAVKLNEAWYYVDPTWDDGNPLGAFDYFNITSQELIDTGHNPAPLYIELTDEQICGSGENTAQSFNIFVPNCTATELSYISMDGAIIDGFSDYNNAIVTQKLYSAAFKGETSLEILLLPKALNYDEAVEVLTNSNNGLLFNYIKDVNNMLRDKKIDINTISVAKKPSKNILVLLYSFEE